MDTTGMRTAAVAFASVVLLAAGTAFPQMGGSFPSPGQAQGPRQNPEMPNPIQNDPDNPVNGMMSATQDRMFVGKWLEGGMAEIQLGQLALQKSSNSQVKQFAQRMVDDHTKMNDAIKPVAQRLGVEVPAKLAKKDRRTIAKLSALSGAEFDQAYIKDMVSGHKGDLRDFQEEASSGHDQEVKQAAATGSKTINEHLQMAEQMAEDQNASVGSH